jgi:hypothetical protein
MDQIATPPGERPTAVPNEEHIRHHPRVASVSVREGVDAHKPVVKSHPDLIQRVGLVLEPVSPVIEQVLELHADLAPVDADILVARPKSRSSQPRMIDYSHTNLNALAG